MWLAGSSPLSASRRRLPPISPINMGFVVENRLIRTRRMPAEYPQIPVVSRIISPLFHLTLKRREEGRPLPATRKVKVKS